MKNLLIGLGFLIIIAFQTFIMLDQKDLRRKHDKLVDILIVDFQAVKGRLDANFDLVSYTAMITGALSAEAIGVKVDFYDESESERFPFTTSLWDQYKEVNVDFLAYDKGLKFSPLTEAHHNLVKDRFLLNPIRSWIKSTQGNWELAESHERFKQDHVTIYSALQWRTGGD